MVCYRNIPYSADVPPCWETNMKQQHGGDIVEVISKFITDHPIYCQASELAGVEMVDFLSRCVFSINKQLYKVLNSAANKELLPGIRCVKEWTGQDTPVTMAMKPKMTVLCTGVRWMGVLAVSWPWTAPFILDMDLSATRFVTELTLLGSVTGSGKNPNE